MTPGSWYGPSCVSPTYEKKSELFIGGRAPRSIAFGDEACSTEGGEARVERLCALPIRERRRRHCAHLLSVRVEVYRSVRHGRVAPRRSSPAGRRAMAFKSENAREKKHFLSSFFLVVRRRAHVLLSFSSCMHRMKSMHVFTTHLQNPNKTAATIKTTSFCFLQSQRLPTTSTRRAQPPFILCLPSPPPKAISPQSRREASRHLESDEHIHIPRDTRGCKQGLHSGIQHTVYVNPSKP